MRRSQSENESIVPHRSSRGRSYAVELEARPRVSKQSGQGPEPEELVAAIDRTMALVSSTISRLTTIRDDLARLRTDLAECADTLTALSHQESQP